MFQLIICVYSTNFILKPGLHEPQRPIERSVTLVFSIVVKRRRCALQVSSVARLQNKETLRSTQLAVVVRVKQDLQNDKLVSR